MGSRSRIPSSVPWPWSRSNASAPPPACTTFQRGSFSFSFNSSRSWEFGLTTRTSIDARSSKRSNLITGEAMAKVDFQSRNTRLLRPEARQWIRPDMHRGPLTEPDFDVLWPDEDRSQRGGHIPKYSKLFCRLQIAFQPRRSLKIGKLVKIEGMVPTMHLPLDSP